MQVWLNAKDIVSFQFVKAYYLLVIFNLLNSDFSEGIPHVSYSLVDIQNEIPDYSITLSERAVFLHLFLWKF